MIINHYSGDMKKQISLNIHCRGRIIFFRLLAPKLGHTFILNIYEHHLAGLQNLNLSSQENKLLL